MRERRRRRSFFNVSLKKSFVKGSDDYANVSRATIMKLFDKPYYKLTNVLMSFLGQWPLQTRRQRFVRRTLIVSFMLSIAVPEVIKLISVSDDLESVVECVPPLGLHMLNIIKYTTCAYHLDKLLELMICMEKDWESRSDGRGGDVLHKYAEQGRIITVCYAYYMFVGGTLYVCGPLFPLVLDVVQPLNVSRPREFLFRTEYFIDQDKFFVPIFLHALFTTLVSMIIVVACDTMYGGFVHYACAIFIELGNDLSVSVTNKNDSLDISKYNDRIYRHIVKCVRKHKKAIEFCALLESTYASCFLGIIGMNIFLISFTGVQTVMRMDDPNLIIRYSIFAFGQVMHAFYTCWHGQLLIDHSERITVAVYKSNWYVSSYRCRKLLSLMMIRSSKSCEITAGKLFPVSLETFTTIIKTAMSYFTVLRSLQ